MVRSNDWRHPCGDQPPQNFSLLAQAAGSPKRVHAGGSAAPGAPTPAHIYLQLYWKDREPLA